MYNQNDTNQNSNEYGQKENSFGFSFQENLFLTKHHAIFSRLQDPFIQFTVDINIHIDLFLIQMQ